MFAEVSQGKMDACLIGVALACGTGESIEAFTTPVFCPKGEMEG